MVRQANALNIDGRGFVVADGDGNFQTMTGTGISGAHAADSFNVYFVTGTCTSTLPAAPENSDMIQYIVQTTQILTIQANTGQLIRFGSAVSASAGTCASNARGDSVTLIYHSPSSTWCALGAPQGTWTIT